MIADDLDTLAGLGPPDDPRIPALREAAALLRQLAPRQASGNPLEDPSRLAASWQTEICPNSKELRLVMFDNDDKAMAYLILDTPETYEIGNQLLKDYDKLEGID